MAFEVVTYGAGEVLVTTFNAIASLLNSQTGSVYQPVVRISLMIALLWATTTAIYGNYASFLTSWLIPMFLIVNLFFAPSTTVVINDPVTGIRTSVDNVPWGLAAVAGTISKIGDILTKEIEKTFSLPDDLKYHKTGAVMASNLIANARKFRITNTDVLDSMKSFINQCVVYEALMGRKYTFNELNKSSDIWGLVSGNASPARSFMYRAPAKGSVPRVLTCAQGVPLLNQHLTQNINKAFAHFEQKIFGSKSGQARNNTPGQQLKQFLPTAMNYMTNMSKSANEHMMQQMMIHTVVDSVESKSTELGNAANFAVRRAYLQQRANQETLAGVAGQKLIAMKNVMEALIYAAFIFILPLALMPSGWSAIGRWISLVMWVQMWPPLYAILNFIANISMRAKSAGITAAENGVSISNSVGLIDLHADMASQAGFMSIAVGSLAYALVKGGAASFVHLAGHMAGPATSAASSATESMMTGNYSFGNVSQGTVSANNTTFGQQNDSPVYSSGSFTQSDGEVSRATSSEGNHIVSVANSNLRSSLNLSESMSSSLTDQASDMTQAAENQTTASSKQEAESLRNVADFATHKSTTTQDGNSWNSNLSQSQNESLQKIKSASTKFAKDHNISQEQSNQLLANVSAGVSAQAGISFLGAGASATTSAKIGSNSSNTKATRETISAAKDVSKQHQLSDAFSTARQAMSSMNHSEMTDAGRRFSSAASGSYEKSQQYRKEASQSLQKARSFTNLSADVKSNSSSINANINQDFMNWLPQQSFSNSNGPMGQKAAETINSSQPEVLNMYQQRFIQDRVKSYTSQHDSGSRDAVVKSHSPGKVKNDVGTQSRDHISNVNNISSRYSQKNNKQKTQGQIDSFSKLSKNNVGKMKDHLKNQKTKIST